MDGTKKVVAGVFELRMVGAMWVVLAQVMMFTHI
jgi:hypothetical protein